MVKWLSHLSNRSYICINYNSIYTIYRSSEKIQIKVLLCNVFFKLWELDSIWLDALADDQLFPIYTSMTFCHCRNRNEIPSLKSKIFKRLPILLPVYTCSNFTNTSNKIGLQQNSNDTIPYGGANSLQYIRDWQEMLS